MGRLWVQRLALILGFALVLEALCRFGVISQKILVPPSIMAVSAVSLLLDGEIAEDMRQTLGSVAMAILSAVVFGFIFGVIVHALPRLRRALDPFLATYYAVPFFVFYPVMVAIFGLSHMPIVIVGFMFAVVVMLISTLNGLDRIPRVLGKVARVHQMGRVEAAWKLQLPAAAPHLFTGVKLATSYAFIGVIASEFIMAPSGLGYAIGYAYSNFENRKMYGLMLLVMVIVTSVNMTLLAVETRLMARRAK